MAEKEKRLSLLLMILIVAYHEGFPEDAANQRISCRVTPDIKISIFYEYIKKTHKKETSTQRIKLVAIDEVADGCFPKDMSQLLQNSGQ